MDLFFDWILIKFVLLIMKTFCVMRRLEKIIFIIATVLFLSSTLFADSFNIKEDKIDIIFSEIEKGFLNGNVAVFSTYLSSQNYLSLSNGISGYYSANQSFYVLQEFFKLHKPISFRYSAKSEGKNPYATGFLTYELRGKRETAQVFIALEFAVNSWKISQITIR
jgi:hypothetical protein